MTFQSAFHSQLRKSLVFLVKSKTLNATPTTTIVATARYLWRMMKFDKIQIARWCLTNQEPLPCNSNATISNAAPAIYLLQMIF